MPREHPMACEPIRLKRAALRAHARAREPAASTFNPKVAGSRPARPIPICRGFARIVAGAYVCAYVTPYAQGRIRVARCRLLQSFGDS
jgi:hypothetical protein